jgi:hypothetical protein
MPRKNKAVSYTRTIYTPLKSPKKRYRTHHEAQKAAEMQMLQHPGLELTVYQDTDRGWYLTSKKQS